MTVSSTVPAAFAGLSLLDYLATRFTYLSAAAWGELLAQGRIRCNGRPGAPHNPVARGDLVDCELPEFEPPTVNLDYAVVYQDEWLLAVNKPPGLRVHSSGRFVQANLIYHLRHRHQPPFPEAQLVHRLDADTSGLVLLARDPAVLQALMRQFAEGEVEKRYLAVVSGVPAPAAGTIELPIGPVPGALVPRFAVDPLHGKPALTHYQTLRPLGEGFSLLELRPVTGRTHQLRVHLAAIGHPLAGDLLYTLSDVDYLAWRRNPPPTGWQRQALHSHQLRFLHPVRQTPLCLSAPLAPDLAAFIRELAAAPPRPRP